MRHTELPESFTRLGRGADGRAYVQCTRTGDVLVQTDENAWSHFASRDEWHDLTEPALYPEIVHLRRTLKEVGRREEVEGQAEAIREALGLLGALEDRLRARKEELAADAL